MQVSIAWRLREDFKAIFRCRSFADAKKYFKLWLESVKAEAVKEVIQIAEMFERHREGVSLCYAQSNARAERINGKIQEVKTVGRRIDLFMHCIQGNRYLNYLGTRVMGGT